VYSPISLVSRKLTDQYSNNLFFSESSSSKRDTPLPFLAIPSPTEKSFAIRAIVVFQVREISKKYPRMFFFHGKSALHEITGNGHYIIRL